MMVVDGQETFKLNLEPNGPGRGQSANVTGVRDACDSTSFHVFSTIPLQASALFKTVFSLAMEVSDHIHEAILPSQYFKRITRGGHANSVD